LTNDAAPVGARMMSRIYAWRSSLPRHSGDWRRALGPPASGHAAARTRPDAQQCENDSKVSAHESLRSLENGRAANIFKKNLPGSPRLMLRQQHSSKQPRCFARNHEARPGGAGTSAWHDPCVSGHSKEGVRWRHSAHLTYEFRMDSRMPRKVNWRIEDLIGEGKDQDARLRESRSCRLARGRPGSYDR